MTHLKDGPSLVQGQLNKLPAGEGLVLQVALNPEHADLPADRLRCQLVVARDHHHLPSQAPRALQPP